MLDDLPEEPQPARTITLTSRDIRDAARLLRILAEGESRSSSAVLPDREVLIGRARAHFFDRRSRGLLFDKELFGEPAWDMLLSLYITENVVGRYTVGQLASNAGAPPSTATRWIDSLESSGLIARKEHPTDRRMSFVELTAAGRDALDLYFSGTSATET